MNKVIARYIDGRMVKGITSDFLPTRDFFHVSPAGADPREQTVRIDVADLKALFFVKDFAGNPGYEETAAFDPNHPPGTRRTKVVFKDGEVMMGYATGYRSDRIGFFLEPTDPNSNNERCFIVIAATADVSFVQPEASGQYR